MPNNLPTSIQGNKLVFNIKGIEKSLILDKELLIILCLPENLGCYELHLFKELYALKYLD